jgi:hypothetical protein
MTHAPLRSFCATTAIYAVLALGSTPAWAQDVSAPVSDTPAISIPAPAPAAQPTIVLPAESPAPAAPAATATVQEVPATPPVAAVADEPAPSRSTARRTVAKAEAAPAARSATATPHAPVAPIAAPAPRAVDATPPVAAPPLAQPAVTAPPPAAGNPATVSDTTTGVSPAAWIAGLLAALGAGAVGYFALRSRRREDEYEPAYEEAHDTQPARIFVEPDPAPAMMANEPTGGLEPELPLPAYATIEDREVAPVIERAPEPTVAQRIGTEELVPDTREERDALLEQMVSAEPDAENPFTSRKGRMRRAKLILQAREFEQKETATQSFDWRTYMPSTSNPAPATPPRVTV